MRVGERIYPVKVVSRGPARVELEIGGETVLVDGWPDRQPAPPGPVDLNGERFAAAVRVEAGSAVSTPLPRPVLPSADPGGVATGSGAEPEPTGATPVLPPMPGRVVEVKVKDGDVVRRGAVVLVLEAMKMRSEVTSPVDGIVAAVRVREGSNVRAREPMLFVRPG